MATYLQKHGGVPLDHPRRCTAHRHDGKPCRRFAARGANVCRVHGGGAPQVIAKARERLNLAADRMARELLGIATGAESEAVKLAAVKDALDRAGLGAKAEVSVEVLPWQELLGDVVQITKAQHEAMKRGEAFAPAPAEPLALPPADADIVDAEVVHEHTAVPPDSTGASRDDADRAANPRPDFAEPTQPPSRALVPLEDAAAETAAVNRAARVNHTRRKRR